MTDPRRFIVLGTGGLFTRHVIDTLISSQQYPVAYIQSAPQPPREAESFNSIALEIRPRKDELAKLLGDLHIPFYSEPAKDLAGLIRPLRADFLLVACWPQLLPATVIASVEQAALNLHPSLLPRYRGVDPVAEQLANQDHDFGITLHLLSERYDSGDIVLQKAIQLAGPKSVEKVLLKAAQQGAKLFKQALDSYHTPGWSLVSQE